MSCCKKSVVAGVKNVQKSVDSWIWSGKKSVWKSSSRRKPLILEGARQVGKTWLMREFARMYYENVVYVRFDKDKLLRHIFDSDFDVERILHELEKVSFVSHNFSK